MLAQPLGESTMPKTVQSCYAQVNGTELYYEVSGKGAPLVMLHGGVNPSEVFGVPLADMAKNFIVIAIYACGHGLSKDTTAPWSFEQGADDVAAVLKQLTIHKANVMGYPFGFRNVSNEAITSSEGAGPLPIAQSISAKFRRLKMCAMTDLGLVRTSGKADNRTG
jgi:hypothetical protein